LTPIHTTRSGGLRVLCAWPGYHVPSGVLASCKWVEIKGDGSSARLAPGPGYAWDPVSPFSLKLAPLPDWIIQVLPTVKSRSSWPLRPEAPLGSRSHTALGHRAASCIIDGILDKASSTAEVCRRVRALGRLVDDDRISEPYARRIIERVVGCGSRPVAELLIEMLEDVGAGPEALDRLERWAKLDPETVRRVGGCDFPRPPLRVVPKAPGR
jgi:hypothetical protein